MQEPPPPDSGARAARGTQPSRRTALGREALVTTLLALAWIAAWALGSIQEYAPHASLWFPPAGLTFAALAVLGPRAVPGVTVAAVLVTLRLGEVYRVDYDLGALLVAGALFAAAHVGAFGLGAAALRRWSGSSVPQAVTAFLVVAPLSAALAAAGGSFALASAGVIAPAEARAILLPWFVGDFVGVVALGPALAALLERLAATFRLRSTPFFGAVSRLRPVRPGWRRFVLLFALCLLPLAGSLVLLGGFGLRELATAFLVFFAIVPLMWIVHTEGSARAFAAVAALSVAIAGAGALAGAGEHTTAYQFAMIVLAGSAYFGLAVPSLYLDNEQLRRLATTDPLTGAANRLAFDEAALRETERARRFGTPLSLVLLDLDRFKAVNDTWGHGVGDAVLVEVVDRIRAELREIDLLARVGGEELAVLLPMTPSPAAADTARRLAAALRERPVTRGAIAVPVSASFGVAEVDPAAGFEAARERADRALYDAKRLGRDRVETAGGS
ncbi:MAG: sensor domain-containing diguanylate cyclase [Thermoanaerobaculia bacterium]